MAQGVPFPEANTVLRAPTPEDAAAGTVYDLHVHRYRDLDGAPNVLSKWQLTPEELAEVNATGGVIWFSCWGDTHPPMWISGTDPFDRGRETGGLNGSSHRGRARGRTGTTHAGQDACHHPRSKV